MEAVAEKNEESEEMDDRPVTTPEERKEYARQQRKFLIDKGIKNPKNIIRIFKIAGPGQIQESWKLATSKDWTTETGESEKDLLMCILVGSRENRLGWDRTSAVLEDTGFYVPEAFNARCFYRTLRGAQEILVPNSVRLSKEEEMEVADTLEQYLASRENAQQQ